MISPASACDYCDMHHANRLTILLAALAACAPTVAPTDLVTDPTGSTTDRAVETDGSSSGGSSSGGSGGDGDGGASGTGGALSGGSSTGGEPCPPCPGPAECEAHEVPDGVCEDVCDVLDLACDECGLTPAECGLAHWLCSQGDDPCGVVADKGNDQAGHLCACAMACDYPAPAPLT